MTHILDAYAQIVAAHPDRPALADPSQGIHLSHAQLWRASRAAAGALSAQGVRAQDVVALELGRGALHVIAALGAWHLRAVMVPLDSTWPEQRRQRVLEQSAPRCVIHPEEARRWLTQPAQEPLPPQRLSPSDLAYIIFTSGSTGAPKGVMVEHTGLVPLLRAQIEWFGLTHTSRALWVTSPGFDASISDIGTALLSGACLVVGTHTHPEQTWQDITRHAITHLDYPPGLLGRLPLEPSTLETIVVGGEVCDVEVMRAWSQYVRLVSVYGPTEATICVSAGRWTQRWRGASLGDTIAGMSFHVLDERDTPCPIGQPGHLHIGGPGLARGYLNDDARTRERFIWWQGQRLYRTGDRVVDHGDCVEFLGRIDRQVKLRGLRIELDELEHHIASIHGVRHARVLKRDTHHGAQALVAFLEGTHPHSPSDLRAHLAQHVPPWMIPSHWVWMEALPRNAAQKIDDLPLRSHPLPTARASGPLAHPSHAIAQLCDIWSDVLMTPVAPSQDLFALGATSLDIIEVVDAAQRRGLPISTELWTHACSVAQAWQGVSGTTSGARHQGAEGARHQDAVVSGTILRHRSAQWLESQAQTLGLRPWKRPSHSPTRHVFLTGATGQLGRALVQQWLHQGRIKVSVLIRASDMAHARERAGHLWGTWVDSDMLTIYVGDVTARHFGLCDARWNQLCQSVDTIVHCAAQVNMVRNFDALRQTNLDALEHVVACARSGPPKALHHVSTLSVFVATQRNTGLAMERDTLTKTRHVYGGYAQTKWAAERAMLALREADAPVWIHRLGLVTNLDAAADHDFLTTFVRGIAQAKIAPRLQDHSVAVDITPHGDAVRLLTALVEQAPCDTYHIASPKSVSLKRLFRLLAELDAVELVDPTAWAHAPHDATSDPLAAAARLALARLTHSSPEAWEASRTMDLFQATNIRFDMTHTHTALPHESGVMPPSDEELKAWLARCLT